MKASRGVGNLPGHGGSHAHEARPFAHQVEDALHPFAEVDGHAVANAQLHRFLARLDGAVKKEAVAVRRSGQAFEHQRVVEHVGIHEKDVVAAAQMFRRRPQRKDRPAPVAGIEQACDVVFGRRTMGRGENLVLAVADHQHQFIHTQRYQLFDVPAEQGLAAEFEQRLGRLVIVVAVKTPPHAGGQHQGLHGHVSPPRKVCTW